MYDINGREITYNPSGLMQPQSLTEMTKKERQILLEVCNFQGTHNLIEVHQDPTKKLLVSGILQRANVKNQNGRIYPRDILVKEIAKYIENFVNENRALGELDHPESPIVSLERVSHKILSIRWDGDNVIGEIEILPTPNGNILKTLFESGVNIGISSRGLGNVTKTNEGVDTVQDGFELIAFDFVSNPSTRGAFMFPAGQATLAECIKPLMTESITIKQPKPIITMEQVSRLQDKYTEMLLSRLPFHVTNPTYRAPELI